jgi:hypothetical protein
MIDTGRLCAATERTIDLLKKRRAALIAVVNWEAFNSIKSHDLAAVLHSIKPIP